MRRHLSLLFTSVLVLVAAVPATAAQHRSSKIDRAVQQALRAGEHTQRVIITVRPGARAAIREALRQHGDLIKSDQPLVEGIAAEIHGEDVQVLADHPWILSVSSDAVVTAGASKKQLAAAAAASTTLVPGTLRETLGLPKTGGTWRGAGVTVALIDSGLTPNADVRAARIKGFFDFTNGKDGDEVAAFDDYGHGTHVAGLIGATGAASNYKLEGVAPEVSFLVCKVLDRKGQGNSSDVIKAIEYVIAHKDQYGVKVMNLSLGHPIFEKAETDPLVQAVEQASKAGIVVVASAGNIGRNLKTGRVGYAGITSPGNAPSAITVGATDTHESIFREDDEVAPYSSRGPTWYDAYAKPDIVAPGTKLSSDASSLSYLFGQLPGSIKKSSTGKSFLELSGTSMAAGVTTGVVALAFDANSVAGYNALTPNAVKAILEYSAIPLLKNKSGKLKYDVLTQGAGQINAHGVITLASQVTTSSPQTIGSAAWLQLAGASKITTLVQNRKVRTYSWSQNIVWGNNIVWGSSLSALFDNIVWGSDDDNIVWGSDDDNIVWGSLANVVDDNIVWGSADDDNIVWGSNIVWGNRLLGMSFDDNIVWGSADDDNIVWGNLSDDNIVWGNLYDDNIVWGNVYDDNIIWGSNIVWGNARGRNDNIVWGNSDDNIVWGSSRSGNKLNGRVF